MQSLGLVLVVCVLMTHNEVSSKPWETTTTARSSPPPIGDTIKQLTNQLIDANSTDVVLDTRTPPKIKQQQKEKESIEHSHPGVAEPVDDESIALEEAEKKLTFYKIEKPTTSSGLSTWILLSGNTPPPVTTKTSVNATSTLVTDIPSRLKPLFKKRPTTTKKPIITTTTTSPTTIETTKLNKVKVSALNELLSKRKNNTLVPVKLNISTTTLPPTTTKSAEIENKTVAFNDSMNAIDSISLPLEPKDNEVELTTHSTDSKKTRRPTNKRKKNKNKRRRPATEKISNSTKLANKEKPIGTQLYNYLSREVMPTVGMGLAGLLLTAGLASYFLFPFGAARRNYDIDRKDKEGSYHYLDEFESGGVPEEEAIGKVIAGMQSTTSSPTYNNYRRYNAKNSYSNNVRYRHDYGVNYQPQTESFYDKNKDLGYSPDDSKKFVVGNIPEEVTPVTVPEHGPRSLRRRRQVNDMENEIFSDTTHIPKINSTTEIVTSTPKVNCTTHRAEVAPHKSFVNLLSDLFHMKIRFGLQFLHNATQSVARYLSRVQNRLDDHYSNHTNSTNVRH